MWGKCYGDDIRLSNINYDLKREQQKAKLKILNMSRPLF